ncbi:uncharacterized protein [Triticum aestivum]|uniref:uncharacterized protein n=1 Tax=Triticum aestivum TaxID=4565 RepID=UPI001D02D969|nr:uncharacterized protein LOC123054772 [Triticum aestivum]
MTSPSGSPAAAPAPAAASGGSLQLPRHPTARARLAASRSGGRRGASRAVRGQNRKRAVPGRGQAAAVKANSGLPVGFAPSCATSPFGGFIRFNPGQQPCSDACPSTRCSASPDTAASRSLIR